MTRQERLRKAGERAAQLRREAAAKRAEALGTRGAQKFATAIRGNK